jgi:hypothetical protein
MQMRFDHGWARMNTDKMKAKRIIPYAFISEIRG